MAEAGIRVNMIAPGMLDTPMSREWAAMMREKGQPVGKVEDVVGVVVRCTIDGRMVGRAVGVRTEEVLDLGDDDEGSDAADANRARKRGREGSQMD